MDSHKENIQACFEQVKDHVAENYNIKKDTIKGKVKTVGKETIVAVLSMKYDIEKAGE